MVPEGEGFGIDQTVLKEFLFVLTIEENDLHQDVLAFSEEFRHTFLLLSGRGCRLAPIASLRRFTVAGTDLLTPS